MYLTKKIKAKPTAYLDTLARESGRCYSKIVSLVRKIHQRKGFWLSKGNVQKYMRHRTYGLHSQSVQASADSYFDALKSFFQVRKVNVDAKPPKRTPKHFKVRWKSGAIRHKDGHLILSNGKGREPIVLETERNPQYVEMYYHRGAYYFALVYKVETPPKQETGITVGVDLGEIHPIVSHNGRDTIIYNGRFLRSIVRYREKTKAGFQAKMVRCPKYSKRWYKLLKSKRRTLDKLNAQVKDAEHKITTRFISDCQRAKADTIVIGDLKGIRDRAKFSKKSNQKIHQWHLRVSRNSSATKPNLRVSVSYRLPKLIPRKPAQSVETERNQSIAIITATLAVSNIIAMVSGQLICGRKYQGCFSTL